MGLMSATDYPYVWNWNKWPSQPDSWAPGNRKGQRCRVLVRGAGNARMVEFEDGLIVRTSGNGLRKAK